MVQPVLTDPFAADLKKTRLLGRTPHRVFRFKENVLVKGLLTRVVESEFVIEASRQPLSRREIDMLPEGERNRERSYLFDDTRLITALELVGRFADQVRDCNDDLWEVSGVEDWTDHGRQGGRGLFHYRYTLERVGIDETQGV